MNIFAISDQGHEEQIYRIPLSQDVQGILDVQFADLVVNFFADKDVIPFDGSYNASNDELFVIENFPIEESIIESANNALNHEVLNLNDHEGRLKAIYAADLQNGEVKIYSQVFDTRKIIASRGIPLINKGGTYHRFDSTGIVVHNKLTLVYQDGNLYFESYWQARRIVNLSDFYQAATNEDVDEFMNTELFEVEDHAGFIEDLNSSLRKKIKAIQDRGALNEINIDVVNNKAAELGLEIQIEEGKIVIPRDKHYVKNLIKFLDEDFFITPLTQRRCVTNSKRELQA